MKKGAFVPVLKGVAIGASMLVPGLSGGTMAIILGIYDDILHAVSRFGEKKKENALFLAKVGLGGLLGILLLAKLLLKAVTLFRKPMLFLFLGAILGSIPMLIKKAGIHRLRPIYVLYFSAGLGIVLGLSAMPENWIDFSKPGSIGFFLLLLAGLMIATALVLPGISASYMLLILGLYEVTLSAVGKPDLLFLAPLLIGLGAGILLTTRLLETAMARFPAATYLAVCGFVAGSVREVFPGFPDGWEILFCTAGLLAGFFSVLFLSKAQKQAAAK